MYSFIDMRAGALLILLLFSISCSNESFEPVYEVPEEFEPIVEQFITEAKTRGYDLTINNLIISYSDEIEALYCGKCNSKAPNDEIQKIISINPTVCWMNDYQKEALIFHELGHCFLLRDHDNSTLPNGDPKSMMVKNNLSVYSPCVYAIGGTTECNFVFKRDYYLDELFDQSTPVPDWAK